MAFRWKDVPGLRDVALVIFYVPALKLSVIRLQGRTRSTVFTFRFHKR